MSTFPAPARFWRLRDGGESVQAGARRAERFASLALLNADPVAGLRHVHAWREEALPQFFDLREVWLRFISECREELDRPVDEES